MAHMIKHSAFGALLQFATQGKISLCRQSTEDVEQERAAYAHSPSDNGDGTSVANPNKPAETTQHVVRWESDGASLPVARTCTTY